MDNIAKQLKDSQDALAALKVEHTNLTTSHANITAERDTLKTANTTLTTERDSARTERDGLKTERDTLKTSSDAVTKDRDELKVKVDMIPETVSRKLADHCSAMGISLPKSGVAEIKSDTPGAAAKKDQPELKGRDRLQQGIRAQLVKQGFTKSLSKPLAIAS